MKKTSLLLLACFGLVVMNAQTIFLETFDDPEIPGWTLVDGDGDGDNWAVITFTAYPDPVLVSNSWDPGTGEALTPDNWAISPAIDLSSLGTAPVTLSWDIAGVDPDYSYEKYSVYVGTSSAVADLQNSSVTFTEVVTDNGAGGLDNFYTKYLDLSSFSGQTVYVAFRHHDITDVFRLALDNVRVFGGTATDVASADAIANFSHYYSPETGMLNLTSDEDFSHISVYNTLGQEVISEKLTKNNEFVSLSGLQSGVYIVSVDGKNQSASFKIALK